MNAEPSRSFYLPTSQRLHAGTYIICHNMWITNSRRHVLCPPSDWLNLNYSFFWVITRRDVVWNRRFGITYRSHFQRSRCPSSWTTWPLKMGPISSPETSVSSNLTPRNNLENGRIWFYHGGSLLFWLNLVHVKQKFFHLEESSMFFRNAVTNLLSHTMYEHRNRNLSNTCHENLKIRTSSANFPRDFRSNKQ